MQGVVLFLFGLNVDLPEKCLIQTSVILIGDGRSHFQEANADNDVFRSHIVIVIVEGMASNGEKEIGQLSVKLTGQQCQLSEIITEMTSDTLKRG